MANRKLIVEIVGDSRSLERAFGRSSKAARGFGNDMQRATVGVRRSFVRSVGGATAALVGGAGLVAAFSQTINKAAQFEKALNVFEQVSGATAAQMRDVSEAATELGADITLPATSAKDAADAMLVLAKGGLTVEDSMNAARGSLQLAAAANITAAEAAEIMARQLNAFELSGDQATRVADVLANTANAATGEISDFAIAFQQSSAVAHQFGLTVEQSAAALAELAKAGISGSDAGTSLRTMLTRLVPSTKDAAKTMRRLGIVWRDAEGNLTPFRDLLAQYHEALSELPAAERQAAVQTLFGADAQRAANIIFGKAPAIYDNLVKAVSRQGGAADAAAAQNAGFTGALDALQSVVETLQIQLGTLLLPKLTEAARRAGAWLSESGNQQQVIDGFTNVAGAIQTVIETFANLVAMVGGWKNAIAILVGAWVGFQVAGVTAAAAIYVANQAAAAGTAAAWRAALLATGWGALVVAAGIAVALIVAHWESFKQFMDRTWNSIKQGAVRAFLDIVEPFTHLPSIFGDQFQRAKEAATSKLWDLAAEASNIGAAAGDGFGASFAGAVNEHLATIRAQTQAARTPNKGTTAAPVRVTQSVRVPVVRALGGVPAGGGASSVAARKVGGTGKSAAEKAADARTAAQFGALGFGPGGEALVPGLPALRRVFGRINTALKGTILDTKKARSLMRAISNILSGGMGKVSDDVRRKIQQILGDFDRKLKEVGPKLGYTWRKISVEAFIRSLGLNLTPEQLRRLKAGLSTLGPGMTAPPGKSAAFASAGGVTVNGNVNLYGVQNMREFEGELAKRDRSRPDVRRGAR